MVFSFQAQDLVADPEQSELDRSRFECRGCLICSGCGYTTAFHRDWTGSPVGDRVVLVWLWDEETIENYQAEQIESFAAEVAAHCPCKLGRVIRGLLSAKAPEICRRVIDGEDIRLGRVPFSFRPRHETPAALEFPRGETVTSVLQRFIAAHHVPRCSELGGQETC